MDKFALIYEFNKESPLVIYEAAKEIDNQNYEKAIKLFEIGIAKYPYHPTGYFLNAIALAHNDEFDLAKDNIIKGDSILNEKSTFDYYMDLINKIKLKKEGVDYELDNTITDLLEDSFIEDDQTDNSYLETSGIENKPIVTETLAEIYASQGNYSEALEIFNELKNLKPEITEKIENRIQEIKSLIENKKQNKFGN